MGLLVLILKPLLPLPPLLLPPLLLLLLLLLLLEEDEEELLVVSRVSVTPCSPGSVNAHTHRCMSAHSKRT